VKHSLLLPYFSDKVHLSPNFPKDWCTF